ncbi:unnamed protein product [Cylicocyclus nassatus]|uniref:Uncharacterized protein n=1 Tax=Cylicocyclus nassatus TaxID=53992 RepID=A0AA36H7L0_CYLNA|nr:unnamed protein product [Cylicocyclus nassatus]
MSRLIVVFFSLLTVFLAIGLSWYYNQFLREKKDVKVRRPYDPITILLRKQFHQVDEICNKETKTCFTITDRIENSTGRTLAYRGLRVKGRDGVLLLSEARLLIPKKLTYRNMDTAKWKIDKTTVRLAYARTMIAGVFFSEAVELNSTVEHKILIIGLGGGIINNYLSSMTNQKLDITVVDIDPVMETIATKWYNYQETPSHRIVIEDGLKFVTQAADRGDKYDAIIVDLCINKRQELMCPTEHFVGYEAMSNLAAITAQTGVVIVNIITEKTKFQKADEVHKKYKEHFESCVLLPAGGSDREMFCFRKKKPWNDDPDKLHNLALEVDKVTGFHLVDGMNYTATLD